MPARIPARIPNVKAMTARITGPPIQNRTTRTPLNNPDKMAPRSGILGYC